MVSDYPSFALPCETPVRLAVPNKQHWGYRAAAMHTLHASEQPVPLCKPTPFTHIPLTTTFWNSSHESHTADSVAYSTPPHKFHRPASHNHHKQTDYPPQHRPCPYPHLNPYCHLEPAVQYRSLRSAVFAVRVVRALALRRWAGRVGQVAVSRKNVVLTFAASMRIGVVVVGEVGCRRVAARLRDGGVVRRRACLVYSLRTVSN
jgi:hypothetical protein